MDLVIFPDSRPRIRIKISSSVTLIHLFFTYPLYVGKHMNELQSGNITKSIGVNSFVKSSKMWYMN